MHNNYYIAKNALVGYIYIIIYIIYIYYIYIVTSMQIDYLVSTWNETNLHVSNLYYISNI